MPELQFFNPFADIQQSENRLPHWQQRGAVYFVTFRLADSIPSHLLRDWSRERDTWIGLHPQPWAATTEREYHTRFSGRIEELLDSGYGSCVLGRSACAAVVDRALGHFEGQRISRISSIVMPNHVHVLFVQNAESSLQKILQSWKSYSARMINPMVGNEMPLWQRDYFDRLVRDSRHFANCVRYIRRNPAKANLTAGEYVLYESDVARGIED